MYLYLLASQILQVIKFAFHWLKQGTNYFPKLNQNVVYLKLK